MKLLYVDDVTLIMDTARSVQVTKTCSALAAKGVDVHLIGLNGRGRLDDVYQHYGISARFPITRLPPLRMRYVSSFWYRSIFAASILRNKADIVYTRDLGVAVLANALGRKFIYEMHSMPVRKQQEWMLRKVVQARHLVAITPITHALQRELILRHGLSEDKICVIPCAADLPEAPAAMIGTRAASGSFRVGYVGHLYPGKGGLLIAELARVNPDVEFHLVGEMRDQEAEQLLPPNVVVHGIKSHADAMALLETFDCTLAPYSPRTQATDGKVISDWFSPLKVFEYMAHGKPILCSDLPVIREVLDHETTALLVQPDNVEEWSQALRRIRSDPALAARLGLNAADAIRTRFSYACRADSIIKTARTVLRLPQAA